MQFFCIDRLDGGYAICENDDGEAFEIELSRLPSGVREGDVLEMSDGGKIELSQEETQRRRKKIKDLEDSLWKR